RGDDRRVRSGVNILSSEERDVLHPAVVAEVFSCRSIDIAAAGVAQELVDDLAISPIDEDVGGFPINGKTGCGGLDRAAVEADIEVRKSGGLGIGPPFRVMIMNGGML